MSATLATPQSLFRKSPEEQMYRREHTFKDYFPPAKSPMANDPVSPTTDDVGAGVVVPAEKRKPLLLLVDDNEINLQVCTPRS